MLTVPFVSSIRLVPELLTISTRVRLPVNHRTRMSEGALEFTAEVPTDIDAAESERADFLYSIIESGGTAVPIKGFMMEVSGYAENAWLRSLDPLHTGVRQLAFVKYTPQQKPHATRETISARAVQAA